MCSNYSQTKLLQSHSSGAIREYFNPQIFGQRCCITVKMDVELMRTMCHCPIVAFAASVGPNTINASLLIS